MNGWRRWVLLSCCVSLVGCTTLTAIPTAAARADGGPIGHAVVVRTSDGEEIKGKWLRSTADAVEIETTAGQARSVGRDQIVSVEREEFSTGRTLLLVAGVAGLIWLYTQVKLASILNSTP